MKECNITVKIVVEGSMKSVEIRDTGSDNYTGFFADQNVGEAALCKHVGLSLGGFLLDNFTHDIPEERPATC